MPIIGDLIRQIQIAIDTFWYQLLMTLAGFQWSLLRGAFMMGYTIQLLSNWLVSQAFSPLIQQTGDSLRVATSWAFVIALFVLGITYLLASIVRLDVVSPRNAILWFLAGLIFFQVGPALYRGMNDFRRTISSAFYLSVLGTMRSTSGSALASLNNVQTSDLGILTPCDNFGPFLGRPGGHGAPIVINGLDVALAYLRADGIDVMGYSYPTSDNCQPHVPPQSFSIPWEWQRPNSFFDNTRTPTFFATLTDAQRAASLGMASAAQWRLFSAWPLALFGIFEQIVALCLTIAQGLTFISFACAILFAFFKRTEGIAWSVIDQWLELIVQTVIIAMIQALVAGFFLAGAATNNGLVVLGIGLLCMVLMFILLLSGIKAIWRSFNRLFDSFGKATGGSIIGVGAATGAAVSTGAAIAAGGVSLAGNVLGGASALSNGASWAQAAGIALGGSQALTGAARTLTRLPGLRDTELAEAADHFVEGAVTRQVARGMPVVGRVAGPVAGAALLTDRNPDHAYEDEDGRMHQPMLVPAVGRGLAGLTHGPGWKRKREDLDTDDEGTEGQSMPMRSLRMGRFTPVASQSDLVSEVGRATQRSDYVEQETGEEMEQHITDVARSGQTSGGQKEAEASRLDAVSSRLEGAAEGLERAARTLPVEGRLNVAGASNVASVMGDVIGLVQAARGGDSLKGADNFTVANTMAQALGVTPVENGRPPIEHDLARFGMFANHALTMGLNGAQAERVVREVKESPDGAMKPENRAELVEHLRGSQHTSWDDASRRVEGLEHAARVLPNGVSAYGMVNVPVAPDIHVRPDVQVTVEMGRGDTPGDGLKREAAMSGGVDMLAGASAGEKGGQA